MATDAMPTPATLSDTQACVFKEVIDGEWVDSRSPMLLASIYEKSLFHSSSCFLGNEKRQLLSVLAERVLRVGGLSGLVEVRKLL